MTWGSSWDYDHKCHVERLAWVGWAPLTTTVVDGTLTLLGLAIPEDCLHAPTSYPSADDTVDFIPPGGS
eukprot:4198315-Pyramimonas_sp.AAC.1